MNPFTPTHSFVSTGFYKCNIVMYWKLLRNADQSDINTFHWQEAVSAAVCRIRVQ